MLVIQDVPSQLVVAVAVAAVVLAIVVAVVPWEFVQSSEVTSRPFLETSVDNLYIFRRVFHGYVGELDWSNF